MSPNVCSIHTTLVQAVTIGNEQKIAAFLIICQNFYLQFFCSFPIVTACTNVVCILHTLGLILYIVNLCVKKNF